MLRKGWQELSELAAAINKKTWKEYSGINGKRASDLLTVVAQMPGYLMRATGIHFLVKKYHVCERAIIYF